MNYEQATIKRALGIIWRDAARQAMTEGRSWELVGPLCQLDQKSLNAVLPLITTRGAA